MRPLLACAILALLPLALLFAPLKPMGAPADTIRSVSAAAETACAIRGDGALFCWGDNRSGQVGVGHVSDKEPNPIEVIAKGVTAVAIGYAHACAVADGGLLCWGSNLTAQIGTHKASKAVRTAARVPDRSATAVLTPTRVLDHGVTAVAAGGMHTCAIVDGSLQCWGGDGFAQIGNGTTSGVVLEPTRIFDAGVTAVSAQAEDTCAIVRGALWCWGDNRAGQVGNGGSGKPVAHPFKVIDHGVAAVAVGNNYACAIVARALQCWGAIRNGGMSETPKPEDLILKPEVVIANNVAAVAAGHSHACAIVGSVLECWGYSSGGNIRSGYPVTVPAPEPIIASGVTAVAAGSSVTCAIVGGALRCRGYSGYGTALTVGRAEGKAFDFAGGDLHTIDSSAADAAGARARLPGEVAQYLVGKFVTDGKLTYVVTRASGTVDKNIHDRDIFTRMKLDVVALYALQVPRHAIGDSGIAPIDATIPADAVCDLESERTSRLDDHTPFLVLKDDRFVSVNSATEGRFAKLAPMASGGALLERSLRLAATDLDKIETCASDALARIDKQPVIELYNSDTLIARVPTTPATSWTYPELSRTPISKIVVEPKTGSAADYTIDVRVTSSMRCGDLVLWNWKHGDSIAWNVPRSGNAFGVFRQPLDNEAPTFPAYSAAELRSAIEDARHSWGVDAAIDAATCGEVLSGETYSVRKGTQPVKQIEMVFAKPQPVVPLNCDDYERPSLAVHVASDLGYPVPDWDSKMQCKALPDTPGASIVALSYPQKGTGDSGTGDGDYDLDVSIVDTPTRRVLARNVRKSAFTSDAWRFNGIQIDTGRYRLAADARAFGVRANSGASSRYSPAEDTTLNLYVRHGKQLREVLGGLLVHSLRGEGDDNCTGSFSTLERTIDIAPSIHHGLADLILTSSVTASEDNNSKDHCESIEQAPEVTHTTLRYDGTKYVIPAALNTFP